VLPPLGAVIGDGKPLNFMVTNKWRNLAEVAKLTAMPLLLMASVHVSACVAMLEGARGCAGRGTVSLSLLLARAASSMHTRATPGCNNTHHTPHTTHHTPHAQDEMVPFPQMQRLHAAAVTPYCVWQEFPDAAHMDAYETNRELYWPALRAFFDDYVLSDAGKQRVDAAAARERDRQQQKGRQAAQQQVGGGDG
jgi:hypothetical protein